MEITLETYFWLVDRCGMDDDQRNKVNMTAQNVQLGKVLVSKLKNGTIFGKLLGEMHSTFIKRTKKPFKLDPNVRELKDNDGVANRTKSWDFLEKEMVNFGIQLDNASKKQIVAQETAPLADLLNQLYAIDNNPKATPSGNPVKNKR